MLLNTVFNKAKIKYFKENKHLITTELLDTLRSFGNDGKHVALEILDMEQDAEKYYLDAFGNRISFNGNRRVKKIMTQFNLSPIHFEELKRCSEDINYFKDNYVKIRTKSGVNFPELREYQNDFINTLAGPSEGIIGLMGRQCCSANTTISVINNSKKCEQTFEELFNECKAENTK